MATKLTKAQKEALTEKVTGLIRNGPALRMTTDSSVNEMNINQISSELNRIHYRAIGKDLPPVFSFEPKQLGSGDPSPDNIRQIVGYEVDGIGAVYGGELNIDTRVLTLTHTSVIYSEASGWEKMGESNTSFRTGLASRGTGAYADLSNVSNMLRPAMSISPIAANAEPNSFVAGGYLYINIAGATTIEALGALFTRTPLQVVYRLQTPETYTLTPQQMLQLLDQI